MHWSRYWSGNGWFEAKRSIGGKEIGVDHEITTKELNHEFIYSLRTTVHYV